MKRERNRYQGKPALELIEEAIQLLRAAPLVCLVSYYLGALPFVLAVLYFWGEMSRSPFAGAHLVPESLLLGLLFVWMKSCQVIFARHLRAEISGAPFALSAGRFLRIFLNQAGLQATGLFALPLALVLTVPFAWVYAFYQNLVVLDEGEDLDFQRLIGKAARQARLWPGQNHLLLSFLFPFGFFVFLDLVSAFFLLPALLKMFLGIETVFTRSGISALNSTLMAAALGLSYLCVDPILKSVYVLRCFAGESQRSGADLKIALRRAALAPAAVLALAVLVLAAPLHSARAVDPAPTSESSAAKSPATPIGVGELDRTIGDVIQQPKYAWREPRKALAEDSQNNSFLGRLLDRIKPFLKNAVRSVFQWLDSVLRRMFGRQRSSGGIGAGERWVGFMHFLLYALIVATLAGLAWLAYRVWRRRVAEPITVASEPIQPMPDLSDENLAPDQLPQDGWLSLAQKLVAQGELRLAVRAFYLASLAHLASRNLIRLARSKSNRDYDRELKRRAHALPDLVDAFDRNLEVFDRAWYGRYEVSPDVVQQFAENVERIKNYAGAGVPSP